jgi:hypothetical protein
VPAAVSAPLTALLFRRRLPRGAIVLVAALSLGLALRGNELKPLDGSSSPPWTLSRDQAVALTWMPNAAHAAALLDALVPARACVGAAALGGDDPSYLLYGPALRLRVHFLTRQDPVAAADRAGLRYVVVGDASTARTFGEAGWALRRLSSESPDWTLAERSTGDCTR